jgi:Domain of unknown function (DUF4281)
MSADVVFQLANGFALCGWLVLVYAVLRGKEWLRDTLAGCWWPIALCVLYTSIVVLFFGQEEGGFDSLAQVKRLFASDWAVLAGWVHYLAFDLFIGAWIAREVAAKGMSRWCLVPLLPATFLFGPVGLLAFGLARYWKMRSSARTTTGVLQKSVR